MGPSDDPLAAERRHSSFKIEAAPGEAAGASALLLLPAYMRLQLCESIHHCISALRHQCHYCSNGHAALRDILWLSLLPRDIHLRCW